MGHWMDQFDEIQRGLICHCREHAQQQPASLPGYQLMVIIAKLAELLQAEWEQSYDPRGVIGAQCEGGA